MVIIAVAVALPAAASARVPMHGSAKVAAVQGAYAIDRHYHPASLTNWQIYHCTSAYESTARPAWALETVNAYAYWHPVLCREALTKPESENVLRVEGGYWTAVTLVGPGDDGCSIGSYRGQPRLPWSVVNDLFGVRCPHWRSTVYEPQARRSNVA